MEIGASSWSQASRKGSLSGKCTTLLEGLFASAMRTFVESSKDFTGAVFIPRL
jgi:hypothetical protein